MANPARPGLFYPLFALELAVVLWCLGCGGGAGSNPPPPPPPPPPPAASDQPFWAQWGFSGAHSGTAPVAGSSVQNQIADLVYDPFVLEEQAEQGGNLVAHYPAAVVDAGDFYMEAKTGRYIPCSPPGAWRSGSACGPNAWDQMIWNVRRFHWQNGMPVEIWQFASDWKPEPNGAGLGGWEPVFHPLLANSAVYLPGAAGTVWKVNKTTGESLAHIDPFAGLAVVPQNTFVSGPLAADAAGNIYYNVVELADPAAGDPWISADALGAWLVKITPAGMASRVEFAAIVPGAPAAGSTACPGRFTIASDALPWPPSPSAVPPTVRCGSQRPGINVAPAIAADGTVYTVSRAHFDGRLAYLVAVNPDLTPRWQAPLSLRLTDGCGVTLPIAANTTTPNSCRAGTTPGVDPTTNAPGSGEVTDLASSSPTVLPDGAILYGAITRYNGSRGHLFKFDALGNFLGAFDFGWDSTPAVYPHGSTYSIVVKDNHYATGGAYCTGSSPVCGPLPDGPYYITQLDRDLNVEWKFQSTSADPGHPNGYEWCINAPAVDSAGVVYANSEDGNVYSLPQGMTGVFTVPKARKFLRLALGAAYTPLSIGPDGKLYTQNDGHLFILGD